ncbi:hypothetical protein ACE7GA_03425 [Roseomonas sp. CCTCC AB2023176]|uniref:hypothetical protein n=1 Tax=Roseomonas sp. CCTCC AB2023176 TaxID=3342640 RepID=UPI0035DBF7FD
MATLPLTQVLGALAAEAGLLSDFAARAAAALSRSLDGPAGLEMPDLLRDAQALDALEQHVAGLRVCLESLARSAPADVTLDVSCAISALPLAAQAARLSGRGGTAASDPGLELF